MKLFNRVQIIEEGESKLHFNESLATAIGVANGVVIHNGATLHGVALRQRNCMLSEQSGKPAISLVLSPFPVSSWERLIRCSITFSPVAGGLHRTIEALNGIHLYCRHIEAVNTLEISDLYTHNSRIDETESTPPLLAGKDFAIPTSLMTLEAAHPNSESDPEIIELHRYLDRLLTFSTNPAADRGEAIQKAGSLLEVLLVKLTSKGDTKISYRVDWISPLSTLNRLGSLDNYKEPSTDKTADTSRDEGSHSLPKEHKDYALIVRKTARRKFTVEKTTEDQCAIDIYPWSELLWKHRQLPPDTVALKAPGWVLAVCHADSDEKIICWNLYKQGDSALIALEMIVPSDGFEHLWWTWIFDRIKIADGNILVSTTSSRLRGHWSNLRILAMFPFNPSVRNGGRGDIAKLLRCFRELQGTRSDHSRQIDKNNMPAFNEFTKDLESKRKECMERLEGYERLLADNSEESNDSPRNKSTLLVRRVWDPNQGRLNQKYAPRFDSNPFSFTKPLDSEKYDRLYGESKELPRSRLADRITNRIINGENIAIVGAHRSGKTTVLNLIEGRLEEDTPNGIVPIPVRVHAATTPPYEILPAIKEGIEKWIETKGTKELSRLSGSKNRSTTGKSDSHAVTGRLLTTISDYLNSKMLLEDLMSLESMKIAGFGIKFSQSELEIRFLRRLQISLKKLRGLLSALDDDSQYKGRVIIIVIIDEVGNLADWGEEIFLQAWRYAIESPEYAGIRWIISTSRPIQESTKLSPITNVFNESNVGSLPEEECNAMLDAFMDMDLKSFSALDTSDATEVTGMRPVLTFRARGFIKKFTSGLPYFLQVFLYHLYDRALLDESPIMNRKVCAKILRICVIPEISDYLESQWHDIPDDIKRKIYSKLYKYNDARRFTLELPEEELQKKHFSASALKALTRSGLKGDDSFVIAPIVAVWIISTGLHRPEEPDLHARPKQHVDAGSFPDSVSPRKPRAARSWH